MVPEEGAHMPKSHPPYPPEFRAEAVRLVRSGERNAEQLARDLGCSAQAIRTWVKQADLDTGRRHDGLTTAEREELARLRREVRVLREEREILRKAATFFAKEATR
jgi:transposase